MFDQISAFLVLAAMGVGFLAMIVQWPLAFAYGWQAPSVTVVERVERFCGAILVAVFGFVLAKKALGWGLLHTPVLLSLALCVMALWGLHLLYRGSCRLYTRAKLAVGSCLVVGVAIYAGSAVLIAKSLMA